MEQLHMVRKLAFGLLLTVVAIPAVPCQADGIPILSWCGGSVHRCGHGWADDGWKPLCRDLNKPSAGLFACSHTGCPCCCRDMMTPNMIGDGGLVMPKVFRPLTFGPLVFVHRHFSDVSDNNSPVPRDRVYYTFQWFNNSTFIETLGMGRTKLDMQSHKFGIEKTFLDGRASAELIVPFQYSTASDITGQPFTQTAMANTEFGLLAFGGKYLVRRTADSALSVGVRIETPTDRDLKNGPIVHETNSFYFTPYVAWLRTWDRLFVQGFGSHRFRTADMDRTIGGVSRGRVLDPNVISVSGAVGYWAYRNPRGRMLTGIVPTVEFHYQAQLEDEGQRAFNDLVYGDHIDNRNLTAGFTAMFGRNATVAVAYVVPLSTNDNRPTVGPLGGSNIRTDKYFEGQLALQVNYYFGRR